MCQNIYFHTELLEQNRASDIKGSFLKIGFYELSRDRFIISPAICQVTHNQGKYKV